MSGARFTLNRNASRELARTPELTRYLGRVSESAADEVQRRLPWPNILGGITVTGDSVVTAAGAQGRVIVAGHGWHLWEYGTINHGARPAIRPGVQSVLSSVGGRWRSI